MSASATDRLQAGVQAAIAQGLLPANATLPPPDSRPWPIVLLSGLGAWLAAVPLLGVVSLLLRDLILRGPGPYLCGVLALAAAIVVLRARDLPVFMEQLAVPGLLVGGGALAFGLSRDLSGQAASALLALVALAVAAAVRQSWLRALLGAAAAALALGALLAGHWFGAARPSLRGWLALQAILALWLAALALQPRLPGRGAAGRTAVAIEAIAAGWVLMLLASLAIWSGLSFMVAGSLGPWGNLARWVVGTGPGAELGAARIGSVLGAGLAALRILWAWPGLRRPLVGAVALVPVVLAAFLPALGGTLLVLAWTATSQRWRLAGAAALATAWVVGSFYYQLPWPLAHKAAVLLLAALVLAVLSWLSPRSAASGPARREAARPGRRGLAVALIALSALTTLGLVNLSIRDKETLIARGDRVLVELAPVDPRSLMQGDYMALNFRLPGDPGPLRGAQRPYVVARRAANGVAQLQRIATAGDPLAPGEMRIELTPTDGRWTLVTDAWFFKEGDAKRWAAAKYGEFRVTENGQALLVGLSDAQLQPIRTAP